MKITEHIPNSCSGLEPSVCEFSNLRGLLDIEFVKVWKRLYEDFYRFSISEYTDDTHLLMAESEKGKKWWVVGYLNATYDLALPKWEPPKKS